MKLGLNYIGRHDNLKGNAPGYPYCNVCIQCGAPQNNYNLLNKLKNKFREDSYILQSREYLSHQNRTGTWTLKT